MLILTFVLLWLVPITATAGGDPGRGKALFLKYCSGCHGTDGRGGGKSDADAAAATGAAGRTVETPRAQVARRFWS